MSHKNHEHNSRAKILRSTLDKKYIFPSAEADPTPDFPQDSPQDAVQDVAQDALQDVPKPSNRVKKAAEPPRPKRKATLERPDYHALHNNISTPTSKWLALIRDPAKSGRKIREGMCLVLSRLSCGNFQFNAIRNSPSISSLSSN